MLAAVVAPVDAREASPEVHLAFSSNIAVDAPNENDLAAIFLGRKRQWSDGTRVKIAILGSSVEQRTFLQAVAGRSPGQYWAHWRNIVFSGRGIMPKIFSSEKEILDYLGEQKGAIGQITHVDQAVRRGIATLTLVGEPQS
jgi:hypothetical protein